MKDARVDRGCQRRVNFWGCIVTLCIEFSQLAFPGRESEKEEKHSYLLTSETIEAFHRVSRLVEQVLQAASQHNNSLCFLARVASEVHGADELGGMGSSKLLPENNSVGSHERRRRERSTRVTLL